ncbi:MAG TPA: hypothetical protein VF239_05995 [Vicinamibacterales bacterium]
MKLAVVAVVLALPFTADAQPGPERRAPVPSAAIDGVIDALTAHQLVAISDPHGNAGMQQFLRALFADPRFPQTGADLIVEIGNARYQSLADAYVDGGAIDEAALAEVWLNTTVANQISADVEWFRQFRRINATLPPDRRLRILLGDPPIDWARVHTREDHFKWLAQRDSYPAALIQTEIIGKGRKALIIYGHLHFQRRNVGSNFEMVDWRSETIVSLLERAGPTRVFTIWRLEEPLLTVWPEAANWRVPAFVAVAGTTLGTVDTGRLTTFPSQRVRVVDGKVQAIARDQYATLPIEQQLDAVLHLGPDSRAALLPSAAPCQRAGFLEERLRRIAITGIPTFEAENIQKLCRPDPR